MRSTICDRRRRTNGPRSPTPGSATAAAGLLLSTLWAASYPVLAVGLLAVVVLGAAARTVLQASRSDATSGAGDAAAGHPSDRPAETGRPAGD